MKVAVYALCINERTFIKDFVEAARGADLIQLADAGSTDGSVEQARALGAVVRAISIRPWRMDDARNVALALLPGDIDVCIALDLDTTLKPGWRAALEAAWRPGVLLAEHPMAVGRRPDGEPLLRLGVRVHARHGVRWKGPCDEYLVADRTEPVTARIEPVMMESPPGERGRPETLLALRALGVEDDPTDARLAHRYGRALRRAGRNAEALAELERCLTLPGLSDEERNAARRLIGLCLYALNEPTKGLASLTRATEEAPGLKGAWIDLACAHYQQQKWAPALRASLKAMATPAVLSAYDAVSETGAMPEDIASICAWRMGKRREAMDYARRAVALAPGDARLAATLRTMEQETAPRR